VLSAAVPVAPWWSKLKTAPRWRECVLTGQSLMRQQFFRS